MPLSPDAPSLPRPRSSRPSDFDGWLALAAEVEHLFGPMVREAAFHAGLREAIADARAYCIDHQEGGLAGGIVISRGDNRIDWLAVSARARGRGLGASLLGTALSQLDPARPVTVQTFDAGTEEGLPARTLYRRHGFVDGDPCGPTPAGIPTVMMARPPEPGSGGFHPALQPVDEERPDGAPRELGRELPQDDERQEGPEREAGEEG